MNAIDQRSTSAEEKTIIYAFLKDAKSFFQNNLNAPSVQSTIDNRKSQMHELLERCNHILLTLHVNDASDGATSNYDQSHVDGMLFANGDNSSYLDMCMRKPNAGINVIEVVEFNKLGRNEYVDVNDKNGKFNLACNNPNVGDVADDNNDDNKVDDNDSNIYDNYIVENKLCGKSDVCGKKLMPTLEPNDSNDTLVEKEKRDCPFSGLPAAHLNIKKARKIGWLTLNQRRRPFLHILNSYLSKKFYVGLLCDTMENDTPDWWMLLYSNGGTNQMKPAICVELRRFELVRVIAKKRKRERPSTNADVKFELHEKMPKNPNKKLDPIVYQFSTTTTDECDQWYSTLMLLNSESSHSICSGTNRKLPMLPPYECDAEANKTLSDRHHASDAILYINQDLHNYSEGVYEEPEEYYRQKPLATSSPILTYKQIIQPPIDTLGASYMYDVPKSPARPVQIEANPTEHAMNLTEKNFSVIELLETQPNAHNGPVGCIVDNADDYDKVLVNSTSSPTHKEAPGRTKINEIRIKLTSHFKEHSLKYSPEAPAIPTNPIKSRKSSIASTDRPVENAKAQISPVRKFVSHLARMKRASAVTQKTPKSPKSIKRGKKPNDIKTSTVDPIQRTINGHEKTQKRNKVHMIINQLEANGQLTLLSGGSGANNVGSSGYTNGSNINSD